MITNERQYKITRAQLEKLRNAIKSFDMKEAIKRIKNKKLAEAQLEALKSELENLSMQIVDYETLKGGRIETLIASTLEELSNILIRARIAKGLTQKELAESMGLKEQQIQRYEAEEYASANLNRLTEVANALGMNIREIAELRSSDEPIEFENNEFKWDQFPIKEMHRRNWFEDFKGSTSEVVENAEEFLRGFTVDALKEPVKAAARQRVRLGGNVNRYALIAWQCRVINIAKKIELQVKFKKTLLSDDWFKDLIKLSCDKNWAQKTKHFLEEVGIRLIILSHLSHTHLDGAAFLINLGPIVGMTLRHDRLDNFWFVLIHELVHIKEHLSKGILESIFDDLEVDADDIESEADELASEILVPSEKWETALPRYIRSKETIEQFSKELGVASAIVAGKIRREADNYYILKDMVGHGEVRRNFSEFDLS